MTGPGEVGRHGSWSEMLSALAREHSWPAFELHAPAPEGELAALEAELGVALPADLRALLRETNGVFDAHGCPFLDDVAGIADMNRYARGPDAAGFMPLDSLLFFSSLHGNGDYVGYGLPRDGYDGPAVYRWDHEDDSRQWQAPDLATWIRWTLEREI